MADVCVFFVKFVSVCVHVSSDVCHFLARWLLKIASRDALDQRVKERKGVVQDDDATHDTITMDETEITIFCTTTSLVHVRHLSFRYGYVYVRHSSGSVHSMEGRWQAGKLGTHTLQTKMSNWITTPLELEKSQSICAYVLFCRASQLEHSTISMDQPCFV